MLPRRHIRIKVFQSLYALAQQNEDQKFNLKQEFKHNLQAYVNLYHFVINLLKTLREVAESEINIKKQKLIPSKEDLKPNKKFIKNSLLLTITNNHGIYADQEYEKIKMTIKNIFKNIKQSKQYVDYMSKSTRSQEEDKKIILHILKHYLIINEKIHDIIEDQSIYWNDDLIIVYNLLLEKINGNTSINTIKLFRKQDDQQFAHLLLTNTIKREQKTSSIIYDLAKNWDKERIALSDLIIMRMAITELTYAHDIPHKVTLDEYIEISKQYSTPKSKEFINGILDRFIKDILLKKINKS